MIPLRRKYLFNKMFEVLSFFCWRFNFPSLLFHPSIGLVLWVFGSGFGYLPPFSKIKLYHVTQQHIAEHIIMRNYNKTSNQFNISFDISSSKLFQMFKQFLIKNPMSSTYPSQITLSSLIPLTMAHIAVVRAFGFRKHRVQKTTK